MDEKKIFLSSDIMTQSSPQMWEALKNADISPSKDGKDKNILKLQERICQLTGFERILLLPTCSAANLTALMTYSKPGAQVIADSLTHFLWYEGNGVSAIAGLRTKLIDTENGILTSEQVAAAADHSECLQIPINVAVFLENTHTIGGGWAYPIDLLSGIEKEAHKRNLFIHMDGARIFNATVSKNVELSEITKHVDSLSFNLNKIMGVPFGAILCGSQSFIESAAINAKIIGAHSMHKSGMLAAAALTQLSSDNYPLFLENLKKTHLRTRQFAQMLNEIPYISVPMDKVESNLFFMDIKNTNINAKTFLNYMEQNGVLASYRSEEKIRFVVSVDRTASELEEAAERIHKIVKNHV